MNKAVRDFKPWPVGQPLPPGALTWFYHPGLDDEFSLDPARFGGQNGPAPDLAESISLADARQRLFAVPPAAQVDSNVLYAIAGTTWNGKVTATVYVHGLHVTAYAPTGWVLDAYDNWREVVVDVAASTFDTKPIRDLQVFQAGPVDEQAGTVELWVGDAATPDAEVKYVLVP